MSKEETKSKGISKHTKEIIINTEDALVTIYQSTIQVLYEGIRAGKTCPMMGMLSLEMFAGLLHGGAYKGSIKNMPYYAMSQQDFETQNKVKLPDGAEPEQLEALMNSEVPHVFPKLLADQDYFLFKEYVKKFFTVENVGQLATSNLKTLVEGAVSFEKAGAYTMQSKAALVKATEAADNTD